MQEEANGILPLCVYVGLPIYTLVGIFEYRFECTVEKFRVD